jgi:hypothetical protein
MRAFSYAYQVNARYTSLSHVYLQLGDRMYSFLQPKIRKFFACHDYTTQDLLCG